MPWVDAARGQAFATWLGRLAPGQGLLPGSVPTGETEALIEYHALDVTQPVVEQLAAEEQAYAKALIPGQRHG